MKIVGINTVGYGSTGNIMLQVAQTARRRGHEVCTFSRAWFGSRDYGSGHRYVGYALDNLLHRVGGPITGCEGLFSYVGTRRLVAKLRKLDPDVIHLHNIHGWYINLPVLFRYLKESGKKVVWTLHDCWAFTGHCPHFSYEKCTKWQTGCYSCPRTKAYPKSYTDNSKMMYRLKKEWFTGVENMTIVTPSQWLADLVKKSFLAEYEVKVINNGIDLSVFMPADGDFRKAHDCSGHIVLGVAFGWDERKGLDVLVELAKRLPRDYRIVLVGTDEGTDKQLPDNIISIHRTHDRAELAKIYTAADVFVQATREDTYPTVNMEALACGTPVVTFDTGGSPETVDDTCGAVVGCDDIGAMAEKIIDICENRPIDRQACLKKAQRFDMTKRFEEYVELYEQ